MVAYLTLTQMDQVQILMDHQDMPCWWKRIAAAMAYITGLDPVHWGFESLTGYCVFWGGSPLRSNPSWAY